MSKFMSKRFENLEAYTPGEQPQDKKYIKLNTNESPFSPSPQVIKAINESETASLMLYSDPKASNLIKAIAKNYGVDEEEVFVGNGSDEILAFSFFAFCDSETGIAFPDISYGFYEVYADLYGFNKDIVPLDSEFCVVPESFFNKGKTVIIANPNAPTGKCLSLSDIERILNANKDNLVIIDEAYVDFGGESAVGIIHKYDNLLVVQTFSKSRNLAGARLGMAFGNRELIADLNKIKYSFNPYNINRLTLLAGEAAIKDTEYFKNCIEKIIKNREKTTEELTKMGFKVLPSKTNFIFAKSDKISGYDLYMKLKDEGILVRHFKKERISDFIRITIGNEEQMNKFVETIRRITE